MNAVVLIRVTVALVAAAIAFSAAAWVLGRTELHLAAAGLSIVGLGAAGASWLVDRADRRRDP